MKQSFENCQGISLSDYQSTVPKWRDEVVKVWHEKCRGYNRQKGFNSKIPSPFFIDRFGFRSWLASKDSAMMPEYISVPDVDFSKMFKSYDDLVRRSVVGSKLLGTSPPSIDERVHRSVFLDERFGAWQGHLARNGIHLPSETIDWYFSTSLLDVYRNSVFYPRFPVLWGPNYFGRIANQDRDYILKIYGESAVWDFYFLMMVCHEQSHLMQKGEPILNEIAHAILWIDFVLEQGLGPFQVNSETGKTCNIEAPFILGRTKALKGLNYGLLYKDNLAYFDQEVVSSEYSLFVAMTFLVHAGVLRYRYVTDLFCGMLAGDVNISLYLRTGASCHVSEMVNKLVQGDRKSDIRHLAKSLMPSFRVIEP